MSVNQKSGHGTLVAVELDPTGAPGVFTDIAEQGDIGLPEINRNEFDATTQNEDIDSYVLGVLRRGQFTIPLNWIPDEQTHDHITGVFDKIITNEYFGVRVAFPQVTPTLYWIMSGQAQSLKPNAPVDGKLSNNLNLRLSGLMKIGDRIIGAPA